MVDDDDDSDNDDANKDPTGSEQERKVVIRADHVTKIAAELLMDYS